MVTDIQFYLHDLIKLCVSLDMPREVTDEVIPIAETLDARPLSGYMEKLLSIDTAPKAYDAIVAALGDDPRGFKLLTVYLEAAFQTRDAYDKIGVPRAVFTDTMKCLTRFIGEYYVTYGGYGFDRGWWVYRQLSLSLFRLGVLEFEMKGDILSVHIPSDAVMTREALDESYGRAKEFFAKFFPGFNYESIQCGTWLLSPVLRQLLPEGSRILNFQADYEITSVNPDAQDCMGWVFKRKYPDYESLPEETSLQRAIKKRLLSGGQIGAAAGRYKYI